jgi:ketosteroid isomerase-like protein
MKKYLFTLIAFSLMAVASCQEKTDIEKEKETIKAVIEEERAAFFDKDFSRVEATWMHVSSSRKYYFTDEGITKLIGWSEIGEGDKSFIENDVLQADYENINNEYTNFEITVYGNTALVYHNAKWSGKYNGEEFSMAQARILHLVKVNRKWKIDLMAMGNIPGGDEELEE